MFRGRGFIVNFGFALIGISQFDAFDFFYLFLDKFVEIFVYVFIVWGLGPFFVSKVPNSFQDPGVVSAVGCSSISRFNPDRFL